MNSFTPLALVLPLLTLFIFTIIFAYIYKKSKRVRLRGFDYLWFNNLQLKFHRRARWLRLEQRSSFFRQAIIHSYEKFLMKIRIEALRIQVWADQKLKDLKEARINAQSNDSNQTS